MSSIGLASANFDMVRPDKNSWTCVDDTVSYTRENPEYIPVSISQHPFFRGVSHMVAVKFIDDTMIHVVDDQHNASYYINGWFNDGNYYHFWIDAEPLRNYVFLRDNRGCVLSS